MNEQNHQQTDDNKTLSQLIAENEMIASKIQAIGKRFIKRCKRVIKKERSVLEPMKFNTTYPDPADYNPNTKYFKTTNVYRANLLTWFMYIRKDATLQEVLVWVDKELAKEQVKLKAIN